MRSGPALGAHARLLDVHADADHNRSVFTLVGSETELGDALLAGIPAAVERIDLRMHEGAHPAHRRGRRRADPAAPPEDLERAQAAAQAVGVRIGAELGLPVFIYAPPDRRPGVRPGAVGRTGCSAASTKASSCPTTGRRACTRRPEP